jgi:hypothetical protein
MQQMNRNNKNASGHASFQIQLAITLAIAALLVSFVVVAMVTQIRKSRASQKQGFINYSIEN